MSRERIAQIAERLRQLDAKVVEAAGPFVAEKAVLCLEVRELERAAISNLLGLKPGDVVALPGSGAVGVVEDLFYLTWSRSELSFPDDPESVHIKVQLRKKDGSLGARRVTVRHDAIKFVDRPYVPEGA